MIRRDLLSGHWKPYLERAISLKPCYSGGINGGEVKKFSDWMYQRVVYKNVENLCFQAVDGAFSFDVCLPNDYRRCIEWLIIQESIYQSSVHDKLSAKAKTTSVDVIWNIVYRIRGLRKKSQQSPEKKGLLNNKRSHFHVVVSEDWYQFSSAKFANSQKFIIIIIFFW